MSNESADAQPPRGNDAVSDETRRQFHEGAHIFYGNVFQSGTVFLGDLAAGGAPIDLKGSRVAEDELEKVGAVYVPPPPYDTARRLLRSERLVILSGYRHWGRRTTALHLLADHADVVLEAEPNAEPSAIDFRPQHGYLVDTLSSEVAARLSQPFLQRLMSQLRTQAAFLVVTIDGSVALPQSARHHVVDWAETPDVMETLQRHLAWHAGTDDGLRRRAEELARSGPGQQLIHAHLLPYEVDEFARLLIEVAQHGLGIDEAIAKSNASTLRRAAEWFQEHQDVRDRAFMLSLAVLNGAPYQLVIDATERLQRQLAPELSERPAPEAMGASRTQRLMQSGAHLIAGHRPTASGRVPVERVELPSYSFQRAILDHTWQEYDSARQPLLDWLRELGSHTDAEVRGRAGAAIGALSRYEFGYVYERVLLAWATAEDDRTRLAAAIALGVAATDRQLAPVVLTQLHQWCALDASVLLRRTAAATYGIVGMYFPETALHDLKLLVRAEDSDLLEHVAQSVGNLLEADTSGLEYARIVLAALENWTADPDPAVIRNGTLIFLALAARTAATTDDPEIPAAPALLAGAATGNLDTSTITRLWRTALDGAETRRDALATLHEWVRWADRSPLLKPGLDAIVLTLAEGEQDRERQRILYHLHRWASDPTGESTSARELLAFLEPSAEATPLDPDARPPVTLFISYSHRDERLRDQLITHLSPLKRRGLIQTWHDRMIGPGENWRHAIDENLERAAIVLLLISADFLASDYCYEKEFASALAQHRAGKGTVIPILVRAAAWEVTPIGALQAIPHNRPPVTQWSNRDAAWKAVVEAIREVVARLH